jgi:opacity protein-like surface antigen
MLLALNHAARAEGVSGLYVGGSVGIAKFAADNSAYQTQLQTGVAGYGALDFTSASLHDRKTAWWVNTGYMAWPFIGFDASYLHFGELYNQVTGTFTQNAGTPIFVGAATRLRSEGPALGLLFRLPMAEGFDLNLRLADYYGRTTLTNILNAATYSTTEQTANRSSLLAGLGASYVFAGHWSARLDYLRVQQAGDSATGKYNAAMLSLGASYTF